MAEISESAVAEPAGGAEAIPLAVVLWWAAGGLGVLALVWRLGALRSDVLRRGPTRELSLSRVDLVVGFILVGLFFTERLLLGVAGRWVEWSDTARQSMQQVSGLALLASAAFFVVKAWASEAGLRRAGLIPRRPGRDVWVSVVGLPVAAVLTFATLGVVAWGAAQLGVPSPPINHGMLTRLQESPSLELIVQTVFAAVILGPVLEELVFRGLLQTWLLEMWGRRARWPVLIAASAVFAAVHLGATTWHALPGLFVLALVLGWLYEQTGSVWPPVLVHAGFNAVNIGVVLAEGWGGS
ncbi:MAG: JDVT-CTERM system glutamic-type intramembrane protease [Planctomycetota bacterium]